MIVLNAVTKKFEVEICSGDRDTFQLVTDHITVLYPKKGVSELARMTPEAVFEKYAYFHLRRRNNNINLGRILFILVDNRFFTVCSKASNL